MKSVFRFEGRDIRALVHDLRAIERRALMWVDSDLPPCLQFNVELGSEPLATLMSNARTTLGRPIDVALSSEDQGFVAVVPVDVLEGVSEADAVLFETDGSSLVLRRLSEDEDATDTPDAPDKRDRC